MKKPSNLDWVVGVAALFIVVNVIWNTTLTPSRTKLIATASYICSDGKAITASYYRDTIDTVPKQGEQPIPTGSVHLKLSDGRSMLLSQTISASGARYANTNDSIVFWNKGNTAFIQENGTQTYGGCVQQ